MGDTLFWCPTPGFWVWGIVWDHFREPKIDLKVKNRVEGLDCRRSRRTSRSEILISGVTQLLSMLETWFWWLHQCFGVWGIIWDHFQKPQIDLKAKNCVHGLQEVKKDFKKWHSNLGINSAFEHARDMVLVAKPMLWGMGIIWDHFQKPHIDMKAKNWIVRL